MRAVIGAEAEELVAEYAGLGYSAATIQDWQERAHILSSREHDLSVLRLANEVDEHIDFGTRYSDRNGHPMSSASVFEEMIVLAEELDEPALADLMDRIRNGEADVAVPLVLRSRASGCEVIAPRSYWRRPKLAIQETKRGIRRQLRPFDDCSGSRAAKMNGLNAAGRQNDERSLDRPLEALWSTARSPRPFSCADASTPSGPTPSFSGTHR